MKKQYLAYLLTAAMLTSTMPTTVMAATSDLNGHWARNVIEDWESKGLIKGYEDGTFRPSKQVSRAEFVTMMNNAMGNHKRGTIFFKDVAETAWYHGAVAAGVAAGYCTGYEDGTFKPNASITRAEAAVMIANAQNLPSNPAAAYRFRDSASIPSWAKGSVGAVVAAGYMSGYPDGTFGAYRYITRAESVSSLDRAMGNVIIGEHENDRPNRPDRPEKPAAKDLVVEDRHAVVEDEVVTGDLIISKRLESSKVTIEDTTVEGDLIIKGGDSVYLHNVDVRGRIIIERDDVLVEFSGDTRARTVVVEAEATLSARNFRGSVDTIRIDTNEKVTIDVEADEVILEDKTHVAIKEDVEEITVTKNAKNSKITIYKGITVDRIIANSKVDIVGEGKIIKLEAKADGITIDKNLTVKDIWTAKGVEKPVINGSTNNNDGGSNSGGSNNGGSGSNNGGGNHDNTHKEFDLAAEINKAQVVDGKLTVTVPSNATAINTDGIVYNGNDYLEIIFTKGSAVKNKTLKITAPNAQSITLADGGPDTAGVVLDTLTIDAPNAEVTNELNVTTTNVIAVKNGTFIAKDTDNQDTINLTKGTVSVEAELEKAPKIVILATEADTTKVIAQNSEVVVNCTVPTEIMKAGRVVVSAANTGVKLNSNVGTVDVNAAATVIAGQNATITTANITAAGATLTGEGAIKVVKAGADVTVNVAKTSEIAVGANASKITIGEKGNVVRVVTDKNVTLAGTGTIEEVQSTTSEGKEVTITGDADNALKVEKITNVGKGVTKQDGKLTTDGNPPSGSNQTPILQKIAAPKLTVIKPTAAGQSSKVTITNYEPGVTYEYQKKGSNTWEDLTVEESTGLVTTAFKDVGDFEARVQGTSTIEASDVVEFKVDKAVGLKVDGSIQNGKVQIAGDQKDYALVGEVITLVVTADPDYKVVAIEAAGAEVTHDTAEIYHFVMPYAENVVIKATFSKTMDKTELNKLKQQAEEKVAETKNGTVKISENGSDVPNTEKWVTQAMVDALNAAIKQANQADTAEAVTAAVEALRTAIQGYQPADGTQAATEASAELSGAEITAKAGEAINSEVTITLHNDTFKSELAAGADITHWFTGLPTDATAAVKETAAADTTTVKVTIAAKNAVEGKGTITATVPAANLTKGKDLTTTGGVAFTITAANKPQTEADITGVALVSPSDTNIKIGTPVAVKVTTNAEGALKKTAQVGLVAKEQANSVAGNVKNATNVTADNKIKVDIPTNGLTKGAYQIAYKNNDTDWTVVAGIEIKLEEVAAVPTIQTATIADKTAIEQGTEKVITVNVKGTNLTNKVKVGLSKTGADAMAQQAAIVLGYGNTTDGTATIDGKAVAALEEGTYTLYTSIDDGQKWVEQSGETIKITKKAPTLAVTNGSVDKETDVEKAGVVKVTVNGTALTNKVKVGAVVKEKADSNMQASDVVAQSALTIGGDDTTATADLQPKAEWEAGKEYVICYSLDGSTNWTKLQKASGGDATFTVKADAPVAALTVTSGTIAPAVVKEQADGNVTVSVVGKGFTKGTTKITVAFAENKPSGEVKDKVVTLTASDTTKASGTLKITDVKQWNTSKANVVYEAWYKDGSQWKPLDLANPGSTQATLVDTTAAKK